MAILVQDVNESLIVILCFATPVMLVLGCVESNNT